MTECYHVNYISNSAPENDYPIPLDATKSNGIRLQPDRKFASALMYDANLSYNTKRDLDISGPRRFAGTMCSTHEIGAHLPFVAHTPVIGKLHSASWFGQKLDTNQST